MWHNFFLHWPHGSDISLLCEATPCIVEHLPAHWARPASAAPPQLWNKTHLQTFAEVSEERVITPACPFHQWREEKAKAQISRRPSQWPCHTGKGLCRLTGDCPGSPGRQPSPVLLVQRLHRNQAMLSIWANDLWGWTGLEQLRPRPWKRPAWPWKRPATARVVTVTHAPGTRDGARRRILWEKARTHWRVINMFQKVWSSLLLAEPERKDLEMATKRRMNECTLINTCGGGKTLPRVRQ